MGSILGLLRTPVKHPKMPEGSRPAAHAAAFVDFSSLLQASGNRGKA
jgi:hypothetical protein